MADAITSAPDGVGSKRATRADEVGTERRRRTAGTLDRGAHLKLAVPAEIREANPGQHFRWINDTGNRMHALTVQDDYSTVEGVEPVPVGTSEDGKPIYARLCMKPQAYFDADQNEKVELTRETERGLMAAARSDPKDNRPDDVSYVPTGNRISRG